MAPVTTPVMVPVMVPECIRQRSSVSKWLFVSLGEGTNISTELHQFSERVGGQGHGGPAVILASSALLHSGRVASQHMKESPVLYVYINPGVSLALRHGRRGPTSERASRWQFQPTFLCIFNTNLI